MGDSIQATAAALLANARSMVRRHSDDFEASAAPRADWRFLIADVPRFRLVIVTPVSSDGAGTERESASWQWLAEDGWNDSVTVISAASSAAAVGRQADIVFVQAGADLNLGLAAAADEATIVVEVPRSTRGLTSPAADMIEANGFNELRRYLVTPNLMNPKRFTPLDDPAGLRWLLGPSPWHRPKPGWETAVAALARLLRSRAGPLLADGLLIARRGRSIDEHRQRSLPRPYDNAILVTSGHDEGSRAVLVPVLDHRPDEVLKISPRPAFNGNTDSEVSVVRALRQQVETSGSTASRHLPQVVDSIDIGPLRASREAFAGRWSAADLGYRHPETRLKVLRRVLAAATDLTLATESRTDPWSAELFDEHVGRLLGRYRETTRSSRPLDELGECLAARSHDLVGLPTVFARRHYDLGPWNVVLGPADRLTVIDWEIAPPRRLDGEGLAGADHLYFAKYWLHVWLGTQTLADELSAFEFLAETGAEGSQSSDGPRAMVATALRSNFDSMGIDHRFVPLITANVWLEKALYTRERRAGEGSDVGRAGPYLTALANNAEQLFRYW